MYDCTIFNRATSRNLPSQSPCGTKVSLTCQRRCPYIAQACYIILGGSTYFTLLRFGLIAILWTFSRFNTHSGSQTERNFDGNCERIPLFRSKRYLTRKYFDHKSRIYWITKDTRVLPQTMIKNACIYAFKKTWSNRVFFNKSTCRCF